MLGYVKHRQSLQRKSRSKQRTKSTVHSDVPAMGSVGAVAEDPSPDQPLSVVSVQASMSNIALISNIQYEILLQVKNLFQSISQSLESRFSKTDSQISQVMPSQPKDSNISQDVITHASFSGPPAVARLYQPPSDRALLVPYSDCLGYNLGGSAAVRSPTGGASLPRM